MGEFRKFRLLENWLKKPMHQLIKGIIISSYIATGLHEETKWNNVFHRTSYFKAQWANSENSDYWKIGLKSLFTN
jgi:hypothetical protein